MIDLFDSLAFSTLNYVIIGYFLLALFPKENFTYYIIIALVGFYAFLYMIEIINAINSIDDTIAIDFGSFQSIVLLFQNQKVVLAGWTHYICFDLCIASGIVIDNTFKRNQLIPHWLMCLYLPLVLMAGPVGLLIYLITLAIALWLKVKKYEKLISITYIINLLCCFMMVIWIFYFPASMWVSSNNSNNGININQHGMNLINSWSTSSSPQPVPISLLTKYASHPWARFAHTLPAGIWALLLPWQLHPLSSIKYRKLHRYSGYLLLFCVAIMSVGVIYIEYNNLSFVKSDFSKEAQFLFDYYYNNDNNNVCNTINNNNNNNNNNSSINNIVNIIKNEFKKLLIINNINFNGNSNSNHQIWCDYLTLTSPMLLTTTVFLIENYMIFFNIILLWFLMTIIIGIYHIKEKRLHYHRHWMMRHAGSGLWVVFQRIIVVTALFGFNTKQHSLGQLINFSLGVPIGILISTGLAEIGVHLYDLYCSFILIESLHNFET